MKSCSWSPESKSFSMAARHVVNFDQTACYRHSNLTAPETLPGAYWDSVLHRKRRVKTLWHAANQEFQSVNVITGEEASNMDPQLTVHHLNPLNNCLYRRSIYCVFTPYLTKIRCIFHPSWRLATRRVGCRAEHWGWPMSVGAWGLLCTHTFRKEGTHTDDTLWYGGFKRWRIVYTS